MNPTPKRPPARRPGSKPAREPAREPLTELLSVVDALVIVLDLDGHIMSFNRACEELSGYTFEEVRDQLLWEILLPPDEVGLVRERLRRVAAGEGSVRGENHWLTRVGAPRRIVWSNVLLRGSTEATARVVASGIDVTDLRGASEQLQESEDRYRAVVEQASEGITLTDPQWRFLDANPCACEMFGYRREELVRMSVRDIGVPEDLSTHALHDRELRQRRTILTERPMRRKDGTIFTAEISARGLPDGSVVSVVRDITERRRIERALRQSEERFRRVFESDMMGMVFGMLGDGVAEANDYFLRLVGYTRNDLLAGRLRANLLMPPESAPLTEEAVRQAHATGISQPFETEFIRKDGTRVPVLTGAAFIGEAHDFAVGFALDLTELRRAEQRLAESERYLERAQELAHVGTWDVDLATMTATFSDEMLRICGRPADRPMVTFAEFTASLHPDDRPEVERAIQRAARNPGEHKFEHRVVRPDGSVRMVEATIETIADDSGASRRLIGSVQDITERRFLELQLHEAQKLESIGRLAGGVAHDFNNLLTVILGFTETLLDGLPAGDERRATAEQIRTAGRRAAGLTQQLLAFGRRQVFRMQAFDLNAVLAEMRDILQRLVGEQIEIAISPGARRSLVKADRGQIEQVVLNLALNARDAMPAGGRLDIVTADPAPVAAEEAGAAGRWLQLAVSDTGTGMSPEVQAHIFEPFFTTKEVGQGTGLGLATVYGIVSQTGGHIEVNSAPGEGTTFRVFLPCAAEEAGREEAAPAPAPSEPHGEETVLLVEDEGAVRGLVAEVLRRRGYRVIEAAEGDEAIDTAHGHAGVIHLLVTDLAMPGMNGRELARFLTHERPGLRVVFISGYSDQRVEPRGGQGVPEAFLQKPFTPVALARLVRQVLEAPAPDRSEG